MLVLKLILYTVKEWNVEIFGIFKLNVKLCYFLDIDSPYSVIYIME
jgi:hypothetical protein